MSVRLGRNLAAWPKAFAQFVVQLPEITRRVGGVMEIRRSEFRSPLALIMLAIIVILLTIMIVGDEFLNDEILDISGRNWFMMTTHGIWYGEPYKDEKDCEAARKKMLQETEDLLKNHPDVLSAKPCPAADVDACMEDAADSSIGLLRAGKVYCSLNH